MLAVTACCLFAGLIAGRYPANLDVTSTRSHRLSPKTVATLDRLTGPTELVVTVNSASIDARSAERTRDVLDALDRASDKLTVSIVDVASPEGATVLDGVWKKIADRYTAPIEKQTAAISAAAAADSDLAAQLEAVATALGQADTSITETETNAAAIKRFLGESAAFCRLSAQDITTSVTRCRDLLKAPIGRSPIRSFDTAASALRAPLPTISAQLAQRSKNIESAVAAKDEQVPASIRDRLKPLGPALLKVRDGLARVEASITSLPRLPLVNVARVLERSSAALVIGPPAGADSLGRDLAAVDIDALFPPRTDDGANQPRLDLRARTEEVIGSAIASLVNPAPPIVVLLHGENTRFAPEFTKFAQVFDRLHLRGMDIFEWPVWLDKELPSLTKLNPKGDRPVVFVTIYTVPNAPEDAARYINLTHAIEQLVAAGRPVLLSVNPSSMPAIGQPDTMFEFLAPLGLKVDSGLPLLHRTGTTTNPLVSADTLLTPMSGDNPIAAAVRGLRVRLPWAIPLRPQPNAAAAITPLLTVENDNATWAESQWIEFRSVPAAQRPYIRPQDQPKADSQRDDAAGPWTVAAAIERKLPDRADTQRMVIVGSNGWFLDELAEAAAFVDNKRVPINPGNTELLEAGIYWLARQDAAIGTSPQAESAPTIPPLSQGTVSAIRWSLIGGLPLLILLAGAIWRLAHG
jgi:hypothetical protein